MNMNLQFFGGRGSAAGKRTGSRTAAESISKPANATITKQSTSTAKKSYIPTLREYESAPEGTVYLTENGTAYVKNGRGYRERFLVTTADGRTLSGLSVEQIANSLKNRPVTRTSTTARDVMGNLVYSPNEAAKRKRRGY